MRRPCSAARSASAWSCSAGERIVVDRVRARRWSRPAASARRAPPSARTWPRRGAKSRLAARLEVAERLVEVDSEAEAARPFADLGGRQRRRDQVGLEELDGVEARGGRRVELLLERAAQADGGDRASSCDERRRSGASMRSRSGRRPVNSAERVGGLEARPSRRRRACGSRARARGAAARSRAAGRRRRRPTARRAAASRSIGTPGWPTIPTGVALTSAVGAREVRSLGDARAPSRRGRASRRAARRARGRVDDRQALRAQVRAAPARPPRPLRPRRAGPPRPASRPAGRARSPRRTRCSRCCGRSRGRRRTRRC